MILRHFYSSTRRLIKNNFFKELNFLDAYLRMQRHMQLSGQKHLSQMFCNQGLFLTADNRFLCDPSF